LSQDWNAIYESVWTLAKIEPQYQKGLDPLARVIPTF
jgi:hypothetical protein